MSIKINRYLHTPELRHASLLPRHWVFVSGDGEVYAIPAIAGGWNKKTPLSKEVIKRSEPASWWASIGLDMPRDIVAQLRNRDKP